MSTLPPSSIPIFTTVAALREWRQKARDDKKSVGFVPTMGALHEGHISLVRRSLAENDLTALSIFVNPAQFAPHEDLATYPRTLPNDLEQLHALSIAVPDPSNNGATVLRTPSAIFLPTAQEMYPSGITQNLETQKGTFVEVKGYGTMMEGASRPSFFRGVATAVTKLFNAVEPTNAYFGQKDIQQALILKRLVRDTLCSHPDPEHLHIVATARDTNDKLALSSRNAYLTAEERPFATTLYEALSVAKAAWDAGRSKSECTRDAVKLVEDRKAEIAKRQLNAELKLDYLEFNDWQTFDQLEVGATADKVGRREPVLLSGALWVGKTRLIDNLVLGDETKILS
ncbi:hypothetical protein HGRIS_005054 [Hohenbuehelia grisea]|uniref:Pantoate--beta-alanine ligase n=1 Tax=Hohenbuehelia grisea TaxID=104357 RepID=A0ABR3JEH2_9AGAR